MLTVRTNNVDVAENIEIARDEWANLKFGKTVKFNSMDDYEELRMQLLARRKSLTRRQFIQKTAGSEIKLNSNGETALEYFDSKLKNDTLYCLDEPENSLSPKMQIKLLELLNQMARYCGCQLIIATHSPFFLSLPNAKIYNLDEIPVKTEYWTDLPNMRAYFDLFMKYRFDFQ